MRGGEKDWEGPPLSLIAFCVSTRVSPPSPSLPLLLDGHIGQNGWTCGFSAHSIRFAHYSSVKPFYLVVKNTNFIRVGTFSLGFCTLWVHYGASYAEKKKSAFYVRPCVWCLFQCLLTDKKKTASMCYIKGKVRPNVQSSPFSLSLFGVV